MATYFMFGKYSFGSIRDISAQRTVEAEEIIKKAGGTYKDGYSLLGETDIVLIVDFPGNEQAMEASVRLAQHLGIGFTTAPAVSVEEFDKMVG